MASHCQSLSGGLSAPQPPLRFPASVVVVRVVFMVLDAWQWGTLRSCERSAKANGDHDHPRGEGRGEPGPTTRKMAPLGED